jgi:hypothetical protein
MPNFTTRVELHNADADDYEILHSAMETEGFSRTITASDGITYHLPTAEYNRSSLLTRDQVLASAERAATKAQKGYEVLVTESAGRKWVGLQKVGNS